MKRIIISTILLILAYVVNLIFFGGSIWALIILMSFTQIIVPMNKNIKKEMKYRIISLLCIVGMLMIMISRILLHDKILFFIGAVVFSVTLAVLLVKDFLDYIK